MHDTRRIRQRDTRVAGRACCPVADRYVPTVFNTAAAAQWELDQMLRYHAPGDPWRKRLSVAPVVGGFAIMEQTAQDRHMTARAIRVATRDALRAEREAERATWSAEKRAKREAGNARSRAWHARQRPAPVGTAAAALQQIRAERAARR